MIKSDNNLELDLKHNVFFNKGSSSYIFLLQKFHDMVDNVEDEYLKKQIMYSYLNIEKLLFEEIEGEKFAIMSKIYDMYLDLKSQDKNTLLLFKVGIFFIFLDDDARFVSSKLNLKLTNFTPTVVKCGFPTSKLEKYLKLLSPHPVAIVDKDDVKANTPDNYIYNDNVKVLFKEIKEIDVENLSISEAFDKLAYIQRQVNQINPK